MTWVYNQVDEDDEEAVAFVKYIKNHTILLSNEDYDRTLKLVDAGIESDLALLVMMNLSSTKTQFGSNVYIMDEIVASYPLALATWRGFPLLEEIDLNIFGLIEGGLIYYWGEKISENIAKSEFNDDESEETANNLKLENIAPGFLVLFIGYAFALISLLAEFSIFQYKKYKYSKAVALYRNKKFNKLH